MEARTTETTTASPIARYERPESQRAGKMAALGGAARRARSTTWPAEVSSGTRGVFTSHRTLKGLKALGLPMDRIVMDIRSRRGFGFYIVARGLDYPIAHGRTLSEATAALIKLLDPTVETVKDTKGKTRRGTGSVEQDGFCRA